MLNLYLKLYYYFLPYFKILLSVSMIFLILSYAYFFGPSRVKLLFDCGSIILVSLFGIPLFNIFCLLFFFKNNLKKAYKFSIWSSVITLCINLLFFNFISMTDLWSSHFIITLVPLSDIKVQLGIDALNLFFILLNNLFIILCIMFAYHSKIKSKDMLIYLFFLQWGVNGTFCVFDLLGFFIFFESTLVPIFLMILLYGSRERRVRAAFMIAIYTLLGSIFLYIIILYCYSKFGTCNFYFLKQVSLSIFEEKLFWILFFLGFSTKIPVAPLHIWLPEAHVEAPTVGSVLLAVILLKLGSYGMFRFILELVPYQTKNFNSFFGIFSILSIWYTSLTALRQIDLKKIIAYSSVGHMNVIMLGFLFFNAEALEGSLFQMLSHGLVSGSLFFSIGSFYLRFKVRSIEYLGGLMTVFPLLSIFFLLFCMANISFPGTSSFVGEFMIFFGIFKETLVYSFGGALSMILGTAFILWALNRLVFGSIKDTFITVFKDISRFEFFMYSYLLVLIISLGISPSFILNYFSLFSFQLF